MVVAAGLSFESTQRSIDAPPSGVSRPGQHESRFLRNSGLALPCGTCILCRNDEAISAGVPVAKHVRDIPRSGIRDFFDIVQSKKEVISLASANPICDAMAHREAAIYALETGKTSYTSTLAC